MLGGFMEYNVNLLWDDEADVWVATSDDIPGLVLESGSYDALIERIKLAIPELLKLNDTIIKICYRSEKHQQVLV